jgi:Spy/CpxP family protein refolding chaperone
MREFQKFNPEFRNEARATNVRLAKLRGEMLNEMASPETDTSKLNALSDSIGNYHSRLKRITYKYYLDLKSICNPDQKIQLKELFSDTFNSDGPMGSQNGGSRGGRQFRGGFKN